MQMMHVPYKGAANAATDLAAGQIQVMISNYSTFAPLMKGGKVKALAVTSKQPHPAFADLPPIATVAPGFASTSGSACLRRPARPRRSSTG